MAVNVKVGLIGALDMLKFKNMAKVREKHIQAAPAKEVCGDFAINANGAALHPAFIDVAVLDIINHDSAGAKTFILGKEDGTALPYFRAGQYLSLKLQIGDSYITRPYSISSAPKLALEGKYAVTVRKNPEGFAADWMLENLKKGDKIVISSPQGEFYYEGLRDSSNVVALAGGSGITPFLSMACAIRDGAEDFNLTILSGSRTEADILFKNEFDEICETCDKVKIVHVLSEEDREGYEHGFITAELIQKYASDDYSVFICGPEAMYKFEADEIKKLGLPERLVRRETLGVTKNVAEREDFPKEAVGKSFKVTVKQGPTEYVIEAASTEPLLTAFERAGIKAPSRCRSGECGWCRSRLVSGEVYLPEENEGRRWADKKYGFIHPCASFPVSDLLVEVPGEYY